MTALKMMVAFHDTDMTLMFARLVADVFQGHVSILPNVAVLNSARQQSKKRAIELSVAHDNDGIWTVYRCGRDLLLIFAGNGATIDLYTVASDEDERAEFEAAHPQLADLLAELASR